MKMLCRADHGAYEALRKNVLALTVEYEMRAKEGRSTILRQFARRLRRVLGLANLRRAMLDPP